MWEKNPIYFIDFLLFFHLHLIKINIFSLSLNQFMQCDWGGCRKLSSYTMHFFLQAHKVVRAILICSTNMIAHCIKSEHRKDKFTFGRQWEIS